MKKGNLIKMLSVVVLALVSVLNVNAANTYVDASTCEGGKVYTNYYFFLDASPYMTTDYKTIGYYDDAVMTWKLQNVASQYGIFSEEFARVANRGYGVVPIDTTNTNKSISVNGIGLRTFYNMVVAGGVRSSGNDTYLVEHNWSRVQGQVIKEENTSSIKFSYNDISRMMNATIMLKQYPTISPLANLGDNKDYPIQIQVVRKYSLGTLTNMNNVTPIKMLGDNATWEAYLQPALMYVQYCEKTSDKGLEVLHYEPNAGSDTVTNMPIDQYFARGDVTIVSNKIPVREGYTFVGWNNQPSATVANPHLAAGEKIGSSMTIYAIWKKNEPTPTPFVTSYSVVYRPNTTDVVSNMPSSVTQRVGATVIISKEVPVRSGYTFLGWSSVSGATSIEEKYNPGTTYSDQKDLILYAVWKKNADPVIPDNPKTGIEDYIIPFGGAVVASGAGLIVLKKKKSYLQF